MDRTLLVCTIFLSGAAVVLASHGAQQRTDPGVVGVSPHGPALSLRDAPGGAGFQADTYVVGTAMPTDFQTTRAGIEPNPPSNLAVASATSQRVDLTWDDDSSDEDDFRVERKEGAAGSFEQVATMPADSTGYRDESVQGHTTYFYRVLACNFVGCSNPSNEVSVTTKALNYFIGDPEAATFGKDKR